MRTIEFHFDFGSPNAFLAHRVLPAVEQRTGVKFRYVPVLLGGVFKATNNRSPMEAFADIPAKRAHLATETARFIARHAITDYRRNPHFPVNTLAIMRGAIAASHAGCFDHYVEVMFANMWSHGQKLDSPEVIRAVLADNNLDADRLLTLSQTPDVKQALIRNTEDSVARGAFGSPTFFVGTQMFFGKDQLRDAEEEIVNPLAAT